VTNHNHGFSSSEVTYPAITAGDPSRSMVPAQPQPVPAMAGGVPGFGPGAPRGPEILHGSFNQMWFTNCLRRKWLLALSFGVLSALAVTAALLWLFPLSSQITALLEVKSGTVDPLAESVRRVDTKEVELFQQTQLTVLKSQFVLKAALRPTAISQLDAVVSERPDELTWLYDGLRATFAGEVLEIRWDGQENSDDMKKVVDSVIEAYRNEVVTNERIRKKETQEKMAKLHKQLATELKEKIERYQTLSKDLEGPESPIASTVLNMLINDVRLIQSQIVDTKKQLIDIEVGRALAEQQARSVSALEQAVQAAMAEDPTMANFDGEQYTIAQQIRDLQSITKRKASPQIKQLQARARQLSSEIQQYRIQKEAEIRNQLKSAPNDMLAQVMAEYILRRDNLNTTFNELEADYDSKVAEIQSKGERSGEVAMLESEIEQLREVERTMDYKLQIWDVEDGAARERIRVMQRAFISEKVNVLERWLIALLGGTAAFFATCYCVALVEFRRRRLNSPVDVDEGLGIRVLGVLPSIASRRAMAPGSPVAAQLSESIDSVRATIMHDSTSQSRRVILITSPVTMEGTTTVASHLALSLARAGRRTLLIDGDLREPALHRLFGMPVEDGLSEVLRSEMDVADAVRPTNTEGLWLLTAGQCDMEAVQALATDQLQPIFEKLRADFDFIVIDAPPVLSMSDTLSIGQHVDGAVLTVLRDHSEVRQINQAAELLRNMGIRLIGSVVNGMPLKADRRIAQLHRNVVQPKKLAAKAES